MEVSRITTGPDTILNRFPFTELTMTDEELLKRKDVVLRVLNAVINPNSWWEGYPEGWARKRFITHWIEDEVFKTGKIRHSIVD